MYANTFLIKTLSWYFNGLYNMYYTDFYDKLWSFNHSILMLLVCHVLMHFCWIICLNVSSGAVYVDRTWTSNNRCGVNWQVTSLAGVVYL